MFHEPKHCPILNKGISNSHDSFASLSIDILNLNDSITELSNGTYIIFYK